MVPAASDDLELALELADRADEITLARFRAEDLAVTNGHLHERVLKLVGR